MKFAGSCFFIKDDEMEEFSDSKIVVDAIHLEDELDFDYFIADQIRMDNQFEKLKHGDYHIYFEGVANWDSSEYDYGTEYELIPTIVYINFEKLE